MKTKLLLLLASIVCMSAANAQSVLLAGFDASSGQTGDATGTTSAPLQDASAVGNVSFELNAISGTLAWSSYIPFGGTINTQQSSFTTWGTASFTPAPNADSNLGTVVAFDGGGGAFEFVIGNTGSTDITLDKLHFVAKRDAASSPTDAIITYTAGNLSDTVGANTTQTLGGVTTTGFDVDLSSFLTDLTLAAGESATFTWATSGIGTSRVRLDNIAISGTVIPEASAAALIGFAGLALLRRRR